MRLGLFENPDLQREFELVKLLMRIDLALPLNGHSAV